MTMTTVQEEKISNNFFIKKNPKSCFEHTAKKNPVTQKKETF